MPRQYLMLRDLALAFQRRPIPPATFTLIALCCGIHMARVVLGLDIRQVAFSPERVIEQREVYRIFSCFVHSDSYHLLPNMLSILTFHAHLERRFGTLRHFEACFWAILLSKSIYLLIALERFFFHGDSTFWQTPVVGFSGVIFFMALVDCCLFPCIVREVEFPFIGTFRVNSSWYPWVLLISCEMWHPQSSFVGHLSGILAGALVASGLINPFFASKETLQSLEGTEMLRFLVNRRSFVETPHTRLRPIDREILWRIYYGVRQVTFTFANLVVNFLCGLIRFFLGGRQTYFLWQGEGNQLGRDIEMEPVRSRDKDFAESADSEYMKETSHSTDSSLMEREHGSNSCGDSLETFQSLPSGSGDSNSLSQVDSFGSECTSKKRRSSIDSQIGTTHISENCSSSSSGRGVPKSFSRALNVLTMTNQDPMVVSDTLKLLITLVTNATGKGKEDAKYRKIRIAKSRLQECNIPGALDLLKAVGFEIKEDFFGEKFLFYPLHEDPPAEWIKCAMEMVKEKLDETLELLQEKNDDYRRRAGAAALEREKASKLKKKHNQEKWKAAKRARGYAAGMGGGDSKTIFFHGGT